MSSAQADDFRRAGLYDPDGPDAAGRLALLNWLDEQGFGIREMVLAEKEQRLPMLAGDRALRPGARFSLDEASASAGIEVARLDRLRRAAGFPPTELHEPVFTRDDIDAFLGMLVAAELFTMDEALHFARVVGSSLARIADAAVSLFVLDVEAPMRDIGIDELTLAQRNLEAVASLEHLSRAMDTFLRLHLEEAVRRSQEARIDDPLADTVTMAIGFVDLVGFTSVSDKLPAHELGLLVREFEDRAYDLVADHNGRVVKLIGDEVMFVAVDPDDACAAASALVGGFDDRDQVLPRGGLAFGELLARGGDYYGPVVNLASRISDLAVPRELLVTPEVAELAVGFDFEPAGRRQLKGLSDPVRLLALAIP